MHVLFVCAGNICRSPIAERLFRHHAAFHAALDDVTAGSAGVIAVTGHAPVADTLTVLREAFGIDASDHRARPLVADTEADLVLTLDHWVQDRASSLGLAARVDLLGDYAGFPGEEIDDPYGGPPDGYRTAATRIELMVKAVVERLARERSGFDLAAYLDRIGVRDRPEPTLPTLRALQGAHLAAIPFENLDVQLGRSIRLDLPALQDKLVARRRGGYCFEQNTLFLHALRAIGFDVVACEARVRTDGRHVLPRTHMVLVVALEGRRWLTDVGFGGETPHEPVPFGGEEQRQSHWTYRLRGEDAAQALQVRRGDGWADLYAFLPEARYPVDFVVANWFTSTWPESRFVQTLTAQRSTSDARVVLRNLQVTTIDGRGSRERTIAREELIPLLRDTFGLHLPDGARFRALDGEAEPTGSLG